MFGKNKNNNEKIDDKTIESQRSFNFNHPRKVKAGEEKKLISNEDRNHRHHKPFKHQSNSWKVAMERKIYKSINVRLDEILLPNDEKKILLFSNLIERRCIAISQMAVKASQLCNVMIEDLLRKDLLDREWPNLNSVDVFIQMYKQGTTMNKNEEDNKDYHVVGQTKKPRKNKKNNNNNKNHMINAVWEEHFAPIFYPPGERYPFDEDSIYHSAKTFNNTVTKYLKKNIISKQRMAIQEYLCDRHELRQKKNYLTDAILTLMNMNNCPRKIYQVFKEHQLFIQEHWKYTSNIFNTLREPKNIDYLRYYWYICNEKRRTRNNNHFFVPLNKTKVHYMAITTKSIRGLCEDAGLSPIIKTDENCEENLHWSRVFDMEVINSLLPNEGEWNFDWFISTDGISCSVRFHKMSSKYNLSGDGKENDIFAFEKYHNNDNYKCSITKVEVETKKNGRKEMEKTVIGIDPGLKNLVACVELSKETREIVRRKKLSAAEYFHLSGIKWFNQKMDQWKKSDDEYRKAMLDLSNKKDIYHYIRTFNNNYDVIWAFHSKKDIRENKFIVNQLINKTIDDFTYSIIGNREDVRIAYGNTNSLVFDNGNCCDFLKNPNKRILKSIENKIGANNVSMISEWNTSKVCHRCFKELDVVGWKDTGGKFVKNDRLKRCCNRKCPIAFSLVHRDFNAAANIANKLILNPIPISLSKPLVKATEELSM